MLTNETKTNNEPFTEAKKDIVYKAIMQTLAETGLSTSQVYHDLVIGFPAYFLSHAYRSVAPLRREIGQKPFIEVV